MKRFRAIVMFSATLLCGCGDGGDPDDVAEKKTVIPLDQVPPAVLKAAKEAQPDLTFFAAAKDKYNGQDSIELKGKTRSGQIKELEMSPGGKVLGMD